MVRPRDWVKIEYNLENLGTEEVQNIPVKIYLVRTNPATGRAEEYGVGSETWWLRSGAISTYRGSNGQPYTHFTYVQVPANLPSGTYSVVVKVDPDGKIPDSDRTNNSVSLPGYLSLRR
jgi:hypothetical protein